MKQIIFFHVIIFSCFSNSLSGEFSLRKAFSFIYNGNEFVNLELVYDKKNMITCRLPRYLYDEVKENVKCFITENEYARSLTGPGFKTMHPASFNCQNIPNRSFVLNDIKLSEYQELKTHPSPKPCSLTLKKNGLIGIHVSLVEFSGQNFLKP